MALQPPQWPSGPVAQHIVSADGPGLQGTIWLNNQWQTARARAAQAGSCVLGLDEIQKMSNWTEQVKRLWDEDTSAGRDVRIVIIGSAPLLIACGYHCPLLSLPLVFKTELDNIPFQSLI